MIKKLKYQGKEIVLVGTAHISENSVKLVEDTIEKEQPDVVGVELDRARLEQLLSEQKWQETNLTEIVKGGKTYLFLLNVLLSNLQRQIGDNLGIKPGSEMLIAVKKAAKMKIPIQLLDRDVKITLKRAMNKMSLIEKTKLGYGLIAGLIGVGKKEIITKEKIEELKQEDMLNKLMKELGKQMPSIKKVLLDERDEYIAEMIKRSKAKKIVAVVGAGHLNGIVKTIKKNKKINLKKLSTINEKKNILVKFSKYAVLVLFLIAIIYSFYSKGISVTLNVMILWYLIIGVCSAIGALFSRAHPISIITAFVAAPLTVLHPALAAGWFTAYTEAKFNSPKVKDFEKLSNISTLGGFYKNRVTHILLVAALTNVGATIGTLIALPYLASILL